MTRRQLLDSAARYASLTAASYMRVLGANDRINVALVGCGNRGSYLMSVFQTVPGVRVAAVCDVFGEKCDRAAKSAPGADQFSDHRKLLDRKDVDAVVVATPDHWHADITVDALTAGKDVYVEKPLTFRREEGPRIIAAAQTHKRICQVGLQQRSGDVFLKAKADIFDAGLLGKVTMVRAVWHYGPPYDLGDRNEPKPATLDWRRFLGQVPWREWNPHQYHHYRLFLDFGGAAMTDLFTHWIDVVHMLLGQQQPKSVLAAGGIFAARDDRSAPDTVNVVAEYDGFNVTFESTSLAGLPGEHLVFYGARGQLWLSRRRYEFTPDDAAAKPVVFDGNDRLVEAHIGNFIDCCRSRRTPNCDAEVGHWSSRVCIMARESYLHKRRILREL